LKISDISESGGFVRIIELFPPGLPVPELMRDSLSIDLDLRFERLLQSVTELDALADGFCLPELKDASRIHINSIGLASELTKRTGSAIVPTITLRDSNRQNILGSIAYGIFAGIENILVVRGDPYSGSEPGSPKNVYDSKSIASMVSAIRRLESHLANPGRIGEKNKRRISILSPINLVKAQDAKYLEMIRGREFAGVDLFLAETMFEEIGVHLERVKHLRKAGVKIPVIHTIFPLKSYEDAVNCSKKFGWPISREELEGLKERGAEYGLKTARRRYDELLARKELVEGVCISTRGDPAMARLITSS
jgi:5,10-methylenetetrahydrofolate reductase